MNAPNLAQILEGPALVTFKGQSFHSARTLNARFLQESFPIDSVAYGPIDRRARQTGAVITLDPVGEFSDALVDVMLPYRNPQIGQLITPLIPWSYSDVDTGTNQVAITAHGLRLGMPARVGTFGTLPSGLSTSTLYYIGAPDVDHISFHLTEADAVAGTNLVALGTQGTGVSQLVEQEPLVIHTMRGNRLTFPVGAVSAMPGLRFSAIQPLFGPISFECFRKSGAEWDDENSLYTADFLAYDHPGPDKSLVKTQRYGLAWGAVAPFSDFTTRGPLTVDFALGLSPYETDQYGILSRKITALTATLRGVPSGMSEEQLLQYLNLQGAGAGRGVERTLNDFVITGADGAVFARFYNASLDVAPQQFDATNPRAGTLEWATARKFTGAGAPHPVFDIGTSAPSS